MMMMMTYKMMMMTIIMLRIMMVMALMIMMIRKLAMMIIIRVVIFVVIRMMGVMFVIIMERPRGVNCVKTGGKITVRLGSLQGLYERFVIRNLTR